ncbi:MAG TPA: hypothetical protein VFX39_09840, partial [Gemmatimonadaceae bacterium]|nr:hypothetical protein [Gemmatimonadaceae bacterium]
MSAPEGPEDSERRLAALERAVAVLTNEVATLRAELRDRATGETGRRTAGDAFARSAASAATGAAPRPVDSSASSAWSSSPPPIRPTPARSAPVRRRLWDENIDVEALVGRYGTMVLGALTILLGVGAFLRWAVQRVTLGPEMRVGLGALGATAVAALGLWLRERDAAGTATRRFGNVILALALALLHVVAW